MATVNQEIFQKFKKLTVRQDGDGLENKVEVREDEEQSVKFQEIIDLLVAAGYFRARIKGLSPFDKVVGGMTWCIESCNIDIDVDLLFQENSTIGQKISLTEKIVAVLPKMKCPHRVEPHQIQGLDFIHIFPVIQWLVKRSMEFRHEMSSFVRLYAVNQFNKEFPVTNKKVELQQNILDNINTVKEIYRPRRYYKRKNAIPEDLISRVQITLLEYGQYGVRNTSQNKVTETDVIHDEQSQEFRIEQLMNNMAVMNENNVGYDILNEEERKELNKHYAALQCEIKDGGLKSKEEKSIFTMKQQKILLADRCKKLTVEKEKTTKDILENSEMLNTIKLKQEEAIKSLKEMEHSIDNHSGNVKEIEELVQLNVTFRTREVQFKEQCRKELAELEKKIEHARNAPTASKSDLNKECQSQEELEKLKLMRLHLAKKNRIISTLQRQLDETPSRPELAQYQRRFLELYNQVAAKHKETKQYYTLYNTLEDTKFYITKELSLLNSISDSYPEAMQSNNSREEFLKQFENIVEGVKQSKYKIDRKLTEEKSKRDQLSYTLQHLVELQRRYVASVRQLSIECKRHETLLSQYHFDEEDLHEDDKRDFVETSE